VTARLDDLVAGVSVRGLVAQEAVTVLAVEHHGDHAATLTYRRPSGEVASELVYRADEDRLDLERAGPPWTFDADAGLFRLAAEAKRIRLAHLFDPRLAVHLSLLEPLPHQIQAVYGSMLPRHPLRFALCDDPGAGKTIMAGLYIKELLLRGDLKRCLIVAPGGLVAQWQDELSDRFGLRFDILTRDMIEASATADPFVEHDLLIARLDHLSRNDDLVERLRATEWDLTVVDEAHRMSAHRFGGEVKETRRYRLGKVLAQASRHFLLMTATPHDGKDEDFQLFLALLDPDRFEGRPTDATIPDVSDLLRRMVKEKLLRFDGRPLFPERRATTVAYPLSPLERELYEQVTAYVRDEMNLADSLAAAGEGRRGNRVGFAATVLQRRLASSPEAIYQSLSRRAGRLTDRLNEARAGVATAVRDAGPDVDADDLDDLSEEEIEALEDAVVDDATAATTVAELEVEIATVRRLEALADRVRRSGTDRKWTELVGLLDDRPEMVDETGTRRKLIVFTEHRDTLNQLVERLRSWFGRPDAVEFIHGGVRREERKRVQETFTHDKDCVVLVATDAAGEGINLQRAHLVVNYDLPWNPNRIEQRFGRVHRIGQHNVCHLWNLVAEDTREGQVYVRLLSKLEEQRRALGGQVWDVLGAALPGRALRDLLVEAIRYGDSPEARAHLNEVVDATVGEGLTQLVEDMALASDTLNLVDVERIRRDLLEAEARRLQPHYVRAWFVDAFERFSGRMAEREAGRFEVTRVPEPVRQATRAVGGRGVVLARYERVTFDKSRSRVDGLAPAELLAPGHPLFESVLALSIEQLEPLLRQGTVFVDDTDPGTAVRLLVFLDHAVADGRAAATGRRIVSRRFEFVELGPDETAVSGGYAPYLDYRPLTDDELKLAGRVLPDSWLGPEAERAVLNHAVEVAVPAHLAEVRAHTLGRVTKVRAAVRDRLTKQIAYWDARAAELQAQRQPRMNPERAQARADDLASRLASRLGELDREEQLSALPPVVAGAALVVPAGLLARVRGDAPEAPAPFALERAVVEWRAIDAVVAAEEALGHRVTVMPPSNPGFDIRSETAAGGLRFVEVKGRIAGAETFMVTRNEILHALNVPDDWVLALVEVSPDGASHDQLRYLRRPFGDTVHLPFSTTATMLSWPNYWNRGTDPS